MSELKSPLAEDFSIMRGGPVRRILARLFPSGDKWQQAITTAMLAVLASWLPMLVLSWMQGEAYGTQITIPFLRDMAVNVRFLFAVPILILAEPEIDRRLRVLARQFLES